METSYHDFIQEIIKDCKKIKIQVESADFIAFLVSLISLSYQDYQVNNPKDEINNKKRIHDTVIEKLLDQSGPSLFTLKIQYYFTKNYCYRENIIKKHRTRLRRKTLPLIKEICEVNKLDNTREIEKLYQKMLVVATVLSGMGNPRIPVILREVAIALQSILQPSELPRYVTLSKKKKEEQLMELVFIVAGIRLFNRDCQRGGEGIDDRVNKTHSSIIQLLELLMDKIYKFTAIIESSIFNQANEDCDSKDIFWSIEMLVSSRQQEIYLRQLLADLQICEQEITYLICRLKNLLIQLHETVKYKTAVPSVEVYPQFKNITEIWFKLQDEVIALSHINEMLWQLQYFFPKTIDPIRLHVLNKLLKELRILTDAERLEQTMGKLIVDCGDCSLAYPSNNSDFDKTNLQFLGFCIWSFVLGNGALIPGNPNIGVAAWEGKFFAFSSVNAARQFGENPERFLQIALNIVKKRQEYINFFQLFKDIKILNREEKLSEQHFPFKISQNQEVQTEVHVFPTFIDMNYSSSLWTYRQRAVQFANIYRCMTRSTQTAKSHFRTSACLQTSTPKEKAVQTRKECSTNTKKLNSYIYGLRSKDNSVHFLKYSSNE